MYWALHVLAALIPWAFFAFGINDSNKINAITYFCKDPTPLEIFLAPTLEYKEVDYSNCELCTFTVRNEFQDSRPNDLIIAPAIWNIANENFFSRSLRTAQSKCHLAIVCDEIAIDRLPKERYEAAVKCGVQFCVVPSKKWGGGYFDQCAVTFYFVIAYILRNRGRFHRIIFQDLFDTVFQGDPFTTDLVVSSNEIHATHEFLDGNNRFMVNLYKRANITQPEWYKKRFFINGSHFAAFSETLLKFLLIFISVNHFGKLWNDQMTDNYLVFSGILESYNLHYTIEERPQRFINLISGKPTERTSLGNFHAYFTNDQSYAVALHHTYNRVDIMVNMAQFCPIKERDQNLVRNYFGKCRDFCIKEVMKYYHKLDNQAV